MTPPSIAAALSLDACRALILQVEPGLAPAMLTPLTAGWDSLAIDVDDRLIFKFPRTPAAAQRLEMEASLLRAIRPAVTLLLPDLTIHAGPPVFSRHEKIPGEHLLEDQYAALDPSAQDRLANEMALFYSQLHALPEARMRGAGATPIHGWRTPDEVGRLIWPVLPDTLRAFARHTLDAWADLGPDPLGQTFGYFDGHGWNMAFDHEAGRLNGLYDFADAGIGDVHREFVYSDWVSRSLTDDIVTAYGALTGRALDRARIETLSGVLRLWELAEAAHKPDDVPFYLDILHRWFASCR